MRRLATPQNLPSQILCPRQQSGTTAGAGGARPTRAGLVAADITPIAPASAGIAPATAHVTSAATAVPSTLTAASAASRPPCKERLACRLWFMLLVVDVVAALPDQSQP